jgi:IS30 family transposase
LALTLAEREEISRGIAADSSVREIAAVFGRAPSTVSREIERHGGRDKYRAADAIAGHGIKQSDPNSACLLRMTGCK